MHAPALVFVPLFAINIGCGGSRVGWVDRFEHLNARRLRCLKKLNYLLITYGLLAEAGVGSETLLFFYF